MPDYFAIFFVDNENGVECAEGTVQGSKKKINNLKDNDPRIKEGIRKLSEEYDEYADMIVRVDKSTLYPSMDAVQFPDFPFPVKYLGNMEIS